MNRKEVEIPVVPVNKDFNVESPHFENMLKNGDLVPTTYAHGVQSRQPVEDVLRSENFDILGKGADGKYYYVLMPDNYAHEESAEGSHLFYAGNRTSAPLLLSFHTRKNIAAVRGVNEHQLVIVDRRK